MSVLRTTGQFSDSFRPVMDGVGVAAENLATHLQRLGSAYVVTPRAPDADDVAFGFRVLRYHSVPLLGRRPYRIGLPTLDSSFHRTLNAVPFDLVHAHSPFSAGELAASVARRRGIPLVASFHSKYREDFSFAEYAQPLMQWILRRIVRFYEQADVVWVPSAGAGQTLQEYGYRGRFEVVPYGSDISLSKPLKPAASMAVDAKLQTTPGDTVLLYVGQLTRAKNLLFLLEALAALRASGSSFVMAFVGEGNALAELEARTRTLGLSDRVRFVGVVYDRAELARLYARATLFLFPSYYDTSGLVLREAAGCEVPSVVLKGSTVSEGICDGATGFIAPPDPGGYAARVGAALANRRLLAAAGAGARAAFWRSWSQVAEDTITRYQTLVDEWGSGPSARLRACS